MFFPFSLFALPIPDSGSVLPQIPLLLGLKSYCSVAFPFGAVVLEDVWRRAKKLSGISSTEWSAIIRLFGCIP